MGVLFHCFFYFNHFIKVYTNITYTIIINFKTKGGMQTFNIVSEPGIYSLIFRSEKKEAEQFQEWVFEEVLPTIRKHGKYELSDEMKELMQYTNMIKEVEEYKRNYVEPPPGWEEMTKDQQEYEDERFEHAYGYNAHLDDLKDLDSDDILDVDFTDVDLDNIEEHEKYKFYKENFPNLIPK